MPSSLSSAPELLRDQVAALVVQPLDATSVVMRAGPRVFTAEGGQPIRVPKFVDFATFSSGNFGASPTFEGWRGENELIGEDEPEWDEVLLLPSTLKSLKVIHRISNELARHSVVNVVQQVRDALVRRVALAVDYAFLRGDGGSNTPVGLLEMPGRQTDSVAWNVDTIYDAVGLLLAANVDLGGARWIMHPDVFVAARKLKDLQDRYLITPDPTEGNVFRLVGVPVLTSTLMPDDRVILVDPAQVAVGRDLDTSVTVLSERYAEYDQVAIRVVTRLDIAALNPMAIVDLTLTS